MKVSIILALIVTFGTVKAQAAFCTYKGQSYTQGQTWTDGCTQSCTCSNANQGFFSCRTVCLDWSTLPNMCHMADPTAGLCCKQPRCPSHITINIPKAYQAQYPGFNYV